MLLEPGPVPDPSIIDSRPPPMLNTRTVMPPVILMRASEGDHVDGPSGGRVPSPQARVGLGVDQREKIRLELAAGGSLWHIAGRLGRSASRVSRDVARSGRRGRYQAVATQRWAHRQRSRAKSRRRARQPPTSIARWPRGRYQRRR